MTVGAALGLGLAMTSPLPAQAQSPSDPAMPIFDGPNALERAPASRAQRERLRPAPDRPRAPSLFGPSPYGHGARPGSPWADRGASLFSPRPAAATRTTIRYETREAPGTIIISTTERSLTYVLEGGMAVRYAVGVGRDGFSWRGTERVSRKAEWPGWTPPAAMRKRQPYLPAYMPGGPGNPLGARALYLGSTLYRIHGTNEAHTIGQAMSSGCIRMMNDDVIDLYERVRIGAKVVVI